MMNGYFLPETVSCTSKASQEIKKAVSSGARTESSSLSDPSTPSTFFVNSGFTLPDRNFLWPPLHVPQTICLSSLANNSFVLPQMTQSNLSLDTVSSFKNLPLLDSDLGTFAPHGVDSAEEVQRWKADPSKIMSSPFAFLTESIIHDQPHPLGAQSLENVLSADDPHLIRLITQRQSPHDVSQQEDLQKYPTSCPLPPNIGHSGLRHAISLPYSNYQCNRFVNLLRFLWKLLTRRSLTDEDFTLTLLERMVLVSVLQRKYSEFDSKRCFNQVQRPSFDH